MPTNKSSESLWDEHSLDAALSELSHEVPDDFSDQVMRSLARPVTLVSSSPAPDSIVAAPPLSKWQWCALVGGGLIGVGQIARVIFGLWFAATAW
jgi:hypothetical protein